MKEVESLLGHESSSTIQKKKTTGYKGGFLVREIINERSGVATQTRNEVICPGAKSVDETINEMTKDEKIK